MKRSVDERRASAARAISGASNDLPFSACSTGPTLPNTEAEADLWRQGLRLVAGVDEVGRGSLAGPVVAAACILPVGLLEFPGVRDSKALSAQQRERLFDEIHLTAIAIGVGAASRREVDRLNIRRASALAMQRALRHLPGWDWALYDGLPVVELDPERSTAIVHGDASSTSIACASIVAKVVRDGLMQKLDRRHPVYGWARNAGYGTAAHKAALLAEGPCCHHRLSFAPVRQLGLDTSAEMGRE